jgi:hypothetical protein
MINYYFKTWEIQDIWMADIFANSDLVYALSDYASEKEATIAAQSFIDGIKFAKGE